MFDTQNHPNGIILAYIYKKICEYVNCKTEINEFSYKDVHIDSYSYPDSYLQYNELSINYKLLDNKDYYKKRNMKLSVDTHKDLSNIKKIYKNLGSIYVPTKRILKFI